MPSVRSPIQDYLDAIHAAVAPLTDGAVADYIPELAAVDPNPFGICVATADGHVYECGDTRVPFTIQSMSKPFTYGLALADRGLDTVLAKIGVEPSGDPFNEISLAPDSGRPVNPMINAGAIASASLVAGADPAERERRLVDLYSRCAGRPLEVDLDVYASERDTGHRNRAIGHMLRNFGILEDDPEPVLDLYFRQCAVAVDCRDISLMAATLANSGAHPVSGERVFARGDVERILSVMTTCGMYDGSGGWVVGVGLPAKSGVGGGVLAVLPGGLGVGVFSPRLDAQGNSVRGVEVCRRLSSGLGLHLLNVPRPANSAVRAAYTLRDARSRRQRDAAHNAALDGVGDRCAVRVLRGDLLFTALEPVIRDVVSHAADLDVALIDLTEVTHLDPSDAALLAGLGSALAQAGVALVLAGADRHDALRTLGDGITCIRTLDDATEWCEDRLLAAAAPTRAATAEIALAEHGLLAGLPAQQLAQVLSAAQRRPFADGDTLFRAGDAAQDVFLLVAGEVSVEAVGPDGAPVRLSTLLPGTVFGQTAILDGGRRTAAVRGHVDGAVQAIPASAFAQFDDALRAELVARLLGDAYDVIERLTRSLAARA